MKKKIQSTVVFIILIIIIDYIFFIFKLLNKNILALDIAYFFLISLLLVFLFFNFGYKLLFDFKSKFIKISSLLILFFSLSFFITHRLLVINKFYFYTKNYRTNEKGNLWKEDPILSYKGISNGKGTQDFYIGDSIKGGVFAEFDSLGFRTVKQENKLLFDTMNLFLGCSFTFGTYITAEESFTYKTSKLLKNNYINAGGSGYGMGQMNILLDTLLAQHKFKYVFLQLSPWLADRAMRLNAPFIYFYRPIPYFSKSDNNNIKLNSNAYFNTSIKFYKNWNISAISYFDKTNFFFTDGLKIEFHDYLITKIAQFKVTFGLLPKPAKSRIEVEKYFYEYAIEKCKKHDIIPIVLKLAYPDSTAVEITNFLKERCLVIDLDEDLNKEVISTGKAYSDLYGIFCIHKEKRIVFDSHPNVYANELITKKIYTTLINNNLEIK